MAVSPRHHGLLLTFRRPNELVDHLRRVAAQTAGLDTLLVVDNDDDPDVRALLDDHQDAADEVRYLGIGDNPGPAGGIAAGFEEILQRADDRDWLVLLDDDDPPRRDDTFEILRNVGLALESSVPRLGGVGLWGATVRRTGRLRADASSQPAPVDYLPGSACVHYNVGALRHSETHHPDLFFGFDDLDLGLGLRRGGWFLYSSGQAREQELTHMVDDRRASGSVAAPSWRRYYSLRNLIIVLRRDDRIIAPIFMSLVAGIAKPVTNLPLHPQLAWRNLTANLRAIRDGWKGTLGKTVDPLDPPNWLR